MAGHEEHSDGDHAGSSGLNADGSAASGATVRIVDAAGQLVYQGTADSQGDLQGIAVITATYTQAGSDPTAITAINSGPLTITVSEGSTTKSLILTPSIDEKLSLLITL